MVAKYRNGGQTCIAANRIYIQDGVFNAFAEKLAEKTRALKVGRGTEEGVAVGPLIDENALAKVENHLADATAKGARVIAGGQRHALGRTFYEPTVLADVPGEAVMAREETFGPIAPLYRFHSDQEAIDSANATEYGLAAYFYTRDLGRAWRVSEALEYGMIGVNEGFITTEVAPFGGVKNSGMGREGSHDGAEEYLVTKYTLMGGLE
jgi:succinate-semialdehyde dehydrogenase/glutarate-semialdehyde dehydrogenase